MEEKIDGTYCNCQICKGGLKRCQPPMSQKTIEKILDEWFEWNEKYHPLKSFWKKQNEINKQNGSENYPYDYWKEIAKKELCNLFSNAGLRFREVDEEKIAKIIQITPYRGKDIDQFIKESWANTIAHAIATGDIRKD